MVLQCVYPFPYILGSHSQKNECKISFGSSVSANSRFWRKNRKRVNCASIAHQLHVFWRHGGIVVNLKVEWKARGIILDHPRLPRCRHLAQMAFFWRKNRKCHLRVLRRHFGIGVNFLVRRKARGRQREGKGKHGVPSATS